MGVMSDTGGLSQQASDRVLKIESHLKYHGKKDSEGEAKERKKPTGSSGPSSASPLPSSSSRATSLLKMPVREPRSRGLLLKTAVGVSIVSGMAALWKKRHTVAASLMQKGLSFAMQYLVPASSPSQQSIDLILGNAEADTTSFMNNSVYTFLESQFPIDRIIKSLQAIRGSASKEKVDQEWFNLEVATIVRIVVAVYALSIAHFISCALQSLTPAHPTSLPMLTHTPSLELFLGRFDLQLITRLASSTCRESLQQHSMHTLKSRCTLKQIEAVFADVTRSVDEGLGLTPGSTAVLHEIALGEESGGLDGTPDGSEPDLHLQLRDLLDNKGARSLINQSCTTFFAVVKQHYSDAFQKKAAGSEDISVTGLFPSLKSELKRICEEDNEFLLTLHGTSTTDASKVEESPWTSFFLDLYQLQSASASRATPVSNGQLSFAEALSPKPLSQPTC